MKKIAFIARVGIGTEMTEMCFLLTFLELYLHVQDLLVLDGYCVKCTMVERFNLPRSEVVEGNHGGAYLFHDGSA